MVDLLHLAILLLSKCELSDQNLLDLLSRAEAETLPEIFTVAHNANWSQKGTCVWYLHAFLYQFTITQRQKSPAGFEQPE